MKIEHIAIWVKDLERMKEFYCTHFGGTANELYHNPKKKFSSYFITLPDGPRIELMSRPDIEEKMSPELFGYAHIALSLGSRDQVDEFTERCRSAGIDIVGNPRQTGDGYYESVIADPEGNLIEITI